MSEKKPVIIYGASGYTGRLIAEFMRDQQIPFVAAGRNKERVEEAMKLVPGIENAEYEVVAVEHTVEALSDLFSGSTVVCNTVGPVDKFGDATVQACLKAGVHDQVYKVSIIPRGRALGVTMFLPEEDRYSHSRRFIVSQICSLFGGRIAEEMTLGKDGVTTGASNDIERATDIARKMVTKWGLSEKMGPLMYDEATEEVFLGRSAGQQHLVVSADTAKKIDEEVRRIIDECYATAQRVLQENTEKLHLMAEALMLYETIDADQIDDIMSGREPREPKDWGDSDGDEMPGAQVDEPGQEDSSGSPIGGPAGEH